jgi:hypothetical protein
MDQAITKPFRTVALPDALSGCGWALVVVSLFVPSIRTGTDLPGAVCLALSLISIPFFLGWISEELFLAVGVFFGLLANSSAIALLVLRMTANPRAKIVRPYITVSLTGSAIMLLWAVELVGKSRWPSVAAVLAGYFVWLAGLSLIAVGEICRCIRDVGPRRN